MWLAMKATVTTMSSTPSAFSRSTMCSIIGRLTIGIIGLGTIEVSGRSRVPSPPAMITAFIDAPSCCLLDDAGVACRAAVAEGGEPEGDVQQGGVVAEQQAWYAEPP